MTNTDVVLCPICNAPFNPRGLQRHITVKHGKDAANSSPNAPVDSPYDGPSSQSEPCSPIPAIPEPPIGDEALRANQNPMDGDSYFDAKDVLESPMDDNGQAYTELDANPVVIPETKAAPAPAHVPSDDRKDLVESAWIVGAAVEKSATACESMEKNAPIPTPPQKVLSQIPIGSEIMLHGSCWWQNPVSYEFEQATADRIQVTVVGIEAVDAVVHLMCRVPGGQAVWSVLQSEVLEGKYRVVKLANIVSECPNAPPNGKRSYVDAQEEEHKKAQIEFLPILNDYLEAKEKVELAERAFAKIHEKTYSQIENYVLQFGETVDDEGDTSFCVLEEDGVRLRLVEGAGLIFEKI